MNDKQGGKVMIWLSRITTFIMFALLIGGLFLVIVTKLSGEEPNIFGYQLKVVLSGSMEPDIQTGSVIAVKLGGDMSRFNKGDIITFREENKSLVTHRISEVTHSEGKVSYQTKGDNNNRADINQVFPESVTAEYTGLTIPYVGYFVSFLQSKNGALLVIILGGILLLYSLFSIWRTLANVEALHRAKDMVIEDVNKNNSY